MSAGRATGRPRREYLDWLRGIAVLLMIGAHILDSWTRDSDRQTDAFRNAMIIGGMGTVLFLLLVNIMGPSIVVAAFLWRIANAVRGRAILFAVATIVTAFLTPILRGAALRGLPDPLEA